jgi:hypothetical protein
MNLVRKLLSTLGGIFLATLLIAALAPRAARGVAAALVNVINTPSNAVPTSEALGTATVAQFQCVISSISGGGANSGPCFTVPAGKRAVVENVSGSCSVPTTLTISSLVLFNTMTDFSQTDVLQIPLHLAGLDIGGNFGYDFNLPVRFYGDANKVFSITATTNDTTGLAFACTVNVVARLVPTS